MVIFSYIQIYVHDMYKVLIFSHQFKSYCNEKAFAVDIDFCQRGKLARLEMELEGCAFAGLGHVCLHITLM